MPESMPPPKDRDGAFSGANERLWFDLPPIVAYAPHGRDAGIPGVVSAIGPYGTDGTTGMHYRMSRWWHTLRLRTCRITRCWTEPPPPLRALDAAVTDGSTEFWRNRILIFRSSVPLDASLLVQSLCLRLQAGFVELQTGYSEFPVQSLQGIGGMHGRLIVPIPCLPDGPRRFRQAMDAGVRAFRVLLPPRLPGGRLLHGRLMRYMGLEAVERYRDRLERSASGPFHLIGSGGVYTEEEALEYFEAGATSVAINGAAVHPEARARFGRLNNSLELAARRSRLRLVR